MPIMRHPNLPEDQTIDVPDDSVPGHEVAGWVVVDDEPTEDEAASHPSPHPTPEPGEPASAEENR